jgi:hypothetical protein
MKRYLGFVLVAVVALVGARAYAHHSFAATYFSDEMVTIEGELVQFLFRNPHSFVHVLVKKDDAEVIRYAVEWSGAGALGGQGVTRETLKPGDYVVITGAPSRNATDNRILMRSLHRPSDGFGWGQRPGEVVD